MALKRRVTQDEFEKLPEVLQEHYREGDGGYNLQDEGTSGLETAYGKANDANKELKQRLAERDEKLTSLEAQVSELNQQIVESDRRRKSESEGVDHDAVQRRAAELAEEMFNERLADHKTTIENLTKERDTANETVKSIKEETHRTTLRETLMRGLKQAGVREGALEEVTILAMEAGGFNDFDEDEDGNRYAIVKGDKGPRQLSDGSGIFQPQHWVDRQRDVKTHWFDQPGGTGTRQSALNGSSHSHSLANKPVAEMTPVEKRLAARELGREAFAERVAAESAAAQQRRQQQSSSAQQQQ